MISVYSPQIGDRELENVVISLKTGMISGNAGEYIDKFEAGFAAYSGCSCGVATSSGTTALHLTVASLGIGPGDEVLVSSFTNMASFFAVLYQGARPVPVDIEPDTWNINPSLIEEKITKKTKAIMPVHIYGHPVDMDPVLEIARKHNLYVIEDCAEAHGALYKGQKVGSLGDIGCFSFYANKIITTGEGGMITTNDESLAKKARSLGSLAFGTGNKFMHEDIGYNYRLTNLQAAIGYAQLGKIDEIIERKRKVARYYNENLRDVPGLQLPVEKDYGRNVYWMYHVVLHRDFGFSRDVVMRKLKDCGIETRESFVPYNQQQIFISKGWVKGDECPEANYVAENGFYIPSSPSLEENELAYIVDRIKSLPKRVK